MGFLSDLANSVTSSLSPSQGRKGDPVKAVGAISNEPSPLHRAAAALNNRGTVLSNAIDAAVDGAVARPHKGY